MQAFVPRRKTEQVVKPSLGTATRIISTTPPLTTDSPGTTSVRQRLSHQVPRIRSQARTIHFALIQPPAVTVILQEICCAQATSKTEDLHRDPLSKKMGQFFT